MKEHIILQVQQTFTDLERIVKVLREEDHNEGQPNEPELTKITIADYDLNDAKKKLADLDQEGHNIKY